MSYSHSNITQVSYGICNVLSNKYVPCITYSFSECTYNSYGTCMHRGTTRIKLTYTEGKVCACTIAAMYFSYGTCAYSLEK